LGEGSGKPFRQKRTTWVEGFIAITRVGIGDNRMNEDLIAICVNACSVTAKNHRQLLRPKPDTFEAPEIVMVERRGSELDQHPTVGNLRLRDLPKCQPVEWVLFIE
jgi:hypothetical protein